MLGKHGLHPPHHLAGIFSIHEHIVDIDLTAFEIGIQAIE